MPWDRFDRLSSDNGPHSLTLHLFHQPYPTLPTLPHPTLPHPALTLSLTWKGFSCSRAARPKLVATSSMICMTMRFWSTCVVTDPNSGANSYWFGATSDHIVREKS